MSIAVNIHRGLEISAEPGRHIATNCFWVEVHFSSDEGVFTACLFLPTLDHAQVYAQAINTAREHLQQQTILEAVHA